MKNWSFVIWKMDQYIFSVQRQFRSDAQDFLRISFIRKCIFFSHPVWWWYIQLRQKFIESYSFCILFRALYIGAIWRYLFGILSVDNGWVYHHLFRFIQWFYFSKKNTHTPKSHNAKTKQHIYLNKESVFASVFFSILIEGEKNVLTLTRSRERKRKQSFAVCLLVCLFVCTNKA